MHAVTVAALAFHGEARLWTHADDALKTTVVSDADLVYWDATVCWRNWEITRRVCGAADGPEWDTRVAAQGGSATCGLLGNVAQCKLALRRLTAEHATAHGAPIEASTAEAATDLHTCTTPDAP